MISSYFSCTSRTAEGGSWAKTYTISCSITWILNITTQCLHGVRYLYHADSTEIISGEPHSTPQKRKNRINRWLEPKKKEKKKLDGVSGNFRPGFEPGSSKRKIGLQANCLTTRTTMYPHDWASSKRRTTSPFIPFLTGGCLWKQPCNFSVPSLVPVLHSRTRILACGGRGRGKSSQAYSTCTVLALRRASSEWTATKLITASVKEN